MGNGDVYNWEEYAARVSASGVATAMIARSALIKPWIFTEIKARVSTQVLLDNAQSWQQGRLIAGSGACHLMV